jgi:regulator of replication initiation timing
MGLGGKKTKLKCGDIRKIDFVPAGAQQDSKISIFKSDNSFLSKIVAYIEKIFSVEGQIENIDLLEQFLSGYKALDCVIKSDDADKKNLVEATINNFEASLKYNVLKSIEENKSNIEYNVESVKVIKSIVDEMLASDEAYTNNINKIKEGGNNNMDGIDVSVLTPEVRDYIAKLEKQISDATVVKSKEPVDITKGLPEEVTKAVNEIIEKNKTLEKENKEKAEKIAKIEDENTTKAYIAKASVYTHLGIKPEEFGLVLKSVSSLGTEVLSKLETVLKAAEEMISSGNVFKEFGTHNDNSVATSKEEAWSKIVALANARVTKGENKTQAEAIDFVSKTPEGKELYKIYDTAE